MIHLTNRAIAELIRETCRETISLYPDLSAAEQAIVLKAMAILLHKTGVLDPIFKGESVPQSLLQAVLVLSQTEDRPMDLMNHEDRQVFGRIAYQMLAPMGCQRCIIVGIPGDGPLFITILDNENMPKMTAEEAAKILNTLGRAEPGEVLEL